MRAEGGHLGGGGSDSGRAASGKSDESLGAGLAAMRALGIDILSVGGRTFAELAAVIGEMTLDEFDRMRSIARESASSAGYDAYSRAEGRSPASDETPGKRSRPRKQPETPAEEPKETPRKQPGRKGGA